MYICKEKPQMFQMCLFKTLQCLFKNFAGYQALWF